MVTVVEILSPGTNRRAMDAANTSSSGAMSSILWPTSSRSICCAAARDLPLANRWQPADCYVFVGRAGRMFTAEVYGWTLRDRLPVIPVPLADGDPDVPLDLQAAFTRTYDRSGDDHSLNYRSPVKPPLGVSASNGCDRSREPDLPCEVNPMTGKTAAPFWHTSAGINFWLAIPESPPIRRLP